MSMKIQHRESKHTYDSCSDTMDKGIRIEPSKGQFTWRKEDPSTGKILEGGTSFRLLYMQKFQPEWLPSGGGKEE